MSELRRILWCLQEPPTETNIKQLRHCFARKSQAIEVVVAKNPSTIKSYRYMMGILRENGVTDMVLPYNAPLFDDCLLNMGFTPIYINSIGNIIPYARLGQSIDCNDLPYTEKTRAKKSDIVVTQKNAIVYNSSDETHDRPFKLREVTISYHSDDYAMD